MLIVLNTLVSALIIGVAAWLSRRYPTSAGFLIALPLATMLVLPLAYVQHRDADSVFQMARSILVALPITLLFFVPFLMRDRLSFWGAYALGCALLPLGYFAHRAIMRALG
jgi:ACR3 family arsenite efflux pump ArsB